MALPLNLYIVGYSTVRKVYFIEKQLEMPGGATYFPLATGLLASYARKFLPDWEFHLSKEPIDPDVIAFSVSLWNFNYSLQKAKEIRKKYPSCKFIFGGPSVTEVKANVDLIYGEGEEAFLRAISGLDKPIKTLDDVPSPYLTGVFSGLNANQAIIETNRGCPFGCAYCFWGKGGTKVKFHSLEYVKAEAEWMGINKIPYVFCADGNFGMFPRDVEIAKIYADVKRRYGFPEKFRVCYGKNSEESVFETASILAEAGLCKSVTLSPQSRNPETLKLIGRSNIKDTFFDSMQKRYDEAGIPVYSELILGLPGETLDTFKAGVLRTMASGNQLLIYTCEVLPGTKLAEYSFRATHGIRIRRQPLTPVHCRPTNPVEYEDIVIGTKTMPTEDWKRALVFGWTAQLIHSFKVRTNPNDDVIDYFTSKADAMAEGGGRCDLINGIYFEPEEVAYLRWFCAPGTDPIKQIIHARKNNFRKEKQ